MNRMSTVNRTVLPTFAEKISYYFQLTKPTIMLLVIITGATALFMEGSLIYKPFDFLLVLVALYLTGGSANALNQYFERDIDALMELTKNITTRIRKIIRTNSLVPIIIDCRFSHWGQGWSIIPLLGKLVS